MSQRGSATATTSVVPRCWGLLVGTLLIAVAACGGDNGNQASETTASQSNAAAAPVLSADQQTELAAIRTDAASERISFVGTVSGTDAYVAVVASGNKATVYLCDSAKIALWFVADLATDGTLAAAHQSGARVEAKLAASEVTGTVHLGGTPHGFSAKQAAFPAGLWEGYDVSALSGAGLVRYGWIVLPDGTQRGSKVQTTATSSAGELDTGTGTGQDGTAATPSSPPPPTATDDLAEQCTQLKNNYNLLIGALFPPIGTVDERKKELLSRALSSTAKRFDFLKCEGVVGSL